MKKSDLKNIIKEAILKEVGYGDPNFKTKFRGFVEDPKEEEKEIGRALFKINNEIKPLLSSLISYNEHYKEVLSQQDIVNKNKNNQEYIRLLDEYIKQLEDIEYKIKKGVW